MSNTRTVIRWLALLAATCFGWSAMAQKPPAPRPAQAPSQPSKATCDTTYMPLGKLYYTNSQFDAAYVAFRQCVSLEPNNTEALYSLGRVEIKLRLYSAAIEHFKKAISTDAKFVSAYIGLSQAYSRQFADSSDRRAAASQLDEALRILDDAEKVATTNEQRAAIHNERGTVYRYKGELERALESFKKAAGFSPESPDILFNMGATQMQLKDQMPAAVDSLRKAVGLAPRDAELRAFYAKALRLSGDLKTALSEATQAYNTSNSSRKNPFVVGQYGIISYLNKNMNAAKTALELAIKLDNPATYHENYFYLGRLYLETGQAKEARSQFTKAAFSEPSDPVYWYFLGQANEAAGLKEDACKSYGQALKVRAGYEDAVKASSALKCPAAPSAR